MGLRRAQLTFLTRKGCHLCHQALPAVREVLEDFDADLEVIDVDQYEDLARRFGEEVPVLLLDGVKAFKYRVEPDRLRRRLRRWRRREAGRPPGEA